MPKVILGYLIIISLYLLWENIPLSSSILNESRDTYTYGDMKAKPNFQTNTCTGVDGYKVYIVHDTSTEELGSWDYENATIRLNRTSVDTIAHEVHHMVYDYLLDKGISDPHMYAYAQGYWTQCVYDVVQAW